MNNMYIRICARRRRRPTSQTTCKERNNNVLMTMKEKKRDNLHFVKNNKSCLNAIIECNCSINFLYENYCHDDAGTFVYKYNLFVNENKLNTHLTSTQTSLSHSSVCWVCFAPLSVWEKQPIATHHCTLFLIHK